MSGSSECFLSHRNPNGTDHCGPGNFFEAMFDDTNATSFSSTLSGTVIVTLDGTLVECFGPGFPGNAANMVGNSTLHVLGQYMLNITLDIVCMRLWHD